MKIYNLNLRTKITLLLLIFTCFSCSDFLEEEALDSTLPEDAYSTPGAAEVALNGIIIDWNGNGIFRRNFMMLEGYRSDDIFLRNDNNEDRAALFTQQIIPINSYVTGIYETFYESIANANLAIAGLENTVYEENDNLRLQYIAEAKFYRAFSYFHLVRLFGDLILYVDFNDVGNPDLLQRVSKDEIYAQIVQDLSEAKEFLPERNSARQPEGPFATTAAAYLASVHLTFENWNEAANEANDVIISGQHDLLTNFEDLFKIANENSIEHIFSIRHDDGANNLAGAWFGAPNFSANGGVFRMPLTTDLRDLYSQEDQRFDATFLNQAWRRNPDNSWIEDEDGERALFPIEPRVVSEDSLATAKWWDFDVPSSEVRWKDYTAMRYAEVLLIYAEAVNEGGPELSLPKHEALNRVRRRAGLDDLNGLDASSFREAVRLERRLEFSFEGKRMYDLLRWGTWVQAIQQRSDDRNLGHSVPGTTVLLPIPQSEIDLNPNPNQQNPGYN